VQREAFIERLRLRLAPDAPDTPAAAPTPAASTPAAERVALFVDRLRELDVRARVVCSRKDAEDALERLVSERPRSRVTCASALRWPGIAGKWTAEPGEASFGLCEADWAVAETGTVVVMSSAAARRGYSLLPAVIGFFVPERRVVLTIGDVLRELATVERPLPTCISFISGPSTTADIASTHVVGVHGPREVHVWVIAQSRDSADGHGPTREEAQER
jgi:L-lactate dehydrogenase complex protein LldG